MILDALEPPKLQALTARGSPLTIEEVITLRRMALCVALLGLGIAFSEGSAPSAPVSAHSSLQDTSPPPQIDSTRLPPFTSPDSSRPNETAAASSFPLDLPPAATLQVDEDAALVATSVFEKYRAFRESLSTP